MKRRTFTEPIGVFRLAQIIALVVNSRNNWIEKVSITYNAMVAITRKENYAVSQVLPSIFDMT